MAQLVALSPHSKNVPGVPVEPGGLSVWIVCVGFNLNQKICSINEWMNLIIESKRHIMRLCFRLLYGKLCSTLEQMVISLLQF